MAHSFLACFMQPDSPPYLGRPHPLIQTCAPCLPREILNFTDGVGIGCTRKRLENGIKKAENDSEKWAKALYLDTIRNILTRKNGREALFYAGFCLFFVSKILGFLQRRPPLCLSTFALHLHRADVAVF